MNNSGKQRTNETLARLSAGTAAMASSPVVMARMLGLHRSCHGHLSAHSVHPPARNCCRSHDSHRPVSIKRDVPSRFNIYCQLEKAHIMQRELDVPLDGRDFCRHRNRAIGRYDDEEESDHFDPQREGFGSLLRLPRRYRGLIIPARFYERYRNENLEQCLHFGVVMLSGIKCEYDISDCVGRRWRRDGEILCWRFMAVYLIVLKLCIRVSPHMESQHLMEWVDFRVDFFGFCSLRCEPFLCFAQHIFCSCFFPTSVNPSTR